MGFGGRVVLTVEASQHFVNLLLRDPMLTRYLLSSFVCLSVRPIVQHTPVLDQIQNHWTDRAGFCHGVFLPPILCVIRIFGCLQIRVHCTVLPSGTLSQTLNLQKFATASESCCDCQHNSSTVELNCWPHSRRSTRLGWPHSLLHVPIDGNTLTPLLRFAVYSLYNLSLHLCSSWQDFDCHEIASRASFLSWRLRLSGYE